MGWNSLLAGFVGVWHYANVTDFEYSYKIYTPIEGFEENGLVAKLLLQDGLDSEVSVKLAAHKVTTYPLWNFNLSSARGMVGDL